MKIKKLPQTIVLLSFHLILIRVVDVVGIGVIHDDDNDDDDDDDGRDSDHSEDADSEVCNPPPNQEAWQWINRKKRRRRNHCKQAVRPSSDTVTIISDSMTKNLNHGYTCRETSVGCSCRDCDRGSKHRLQTIMNRADSLREKPTIIHTGTNNVVKENFHRVRDSFLRLEDNLRRLKYKTVTISKSVLLKLLCRAAHWRFKCAYMI